MVFILVITHLWSFFVASWLYLRSKIDPKMGQFWSFLKQSAIFSHNLSKYHQNMFVWFCMFCILLITHLWSFFGASWLYLGPKLAEMWSNLTYICTTVQFCTFTVHLLSKNIYIAFLPLMRPKWSLYRLSWLYLGPKLTQKGSIMT